MCIRDSHSMEDIARYADRIMVMNQGEKAYDGTPKEVFELSLIHI